MTVGSHEPGPDTVTVDALERERALLAEGREVFDVLADLAETRRLAVAELERRLAAEIDARLALEGELRDAELRRAEEAARRDMGRVRELASHHESAKVARAGVQALRDEFGRVQTGARRFARTAATETSRLRAELAQRAAASAAELEALRLERDRLAAQLEVARGDVGALRAELEARQAQLEALQPQLQALQAELAARPAPPADEPAPEPEPEPEPRTGSVPPPSAAAPEHHAAPGTLMSTLAVDAAAVDAHDRDAAWLRSRALALLFVLIVAVAIGMLMLKGYGSYCSGHPCG